MAEEKKVKKPRSTKKTGAGTQIPVETVTEATLETVAEKSAEAAVEAKPETEQKSVKVKKATAKKAVKKEETTVKAEAQQEEKPKKAKAKKTAKKAEEPVKKAEEKSEETPMEKPADKQTAEEKTLGKPKAKKSVKKKSKAAEEPRQEEKREELAKIEEKAVKTEENSVKAEEKRPATKAEKQAERTAKFKPFVTEVLEKSGSCKRSALVQQAADAYANTYGVAEFGNEAGVKGMVGNVLDQMIESGEAFVDGKTVYKEKPTAKEMPEVNEKLQKEPPVSAMNGEKSTGNKQKKTEEPKQMPVKSKAEEAAEKLVEAKTEETGEMQTALTKVNAPAPAPIYDLSALFESRKAAPKKAEENPVQPKEAVKEIEREKTEEVEATKLQKAQDVQTLVEVAPQKAKENDKKPTLKVISKTEDKPQGKAQVQPKKEVPTRRPNRQEKTDALKDAFLKKLRSLGGNYFEYYAIYLLERYSRMNGRRLEGMRISGGEYDGGIDGELELTDRLGFRETIYVQAKNWEPTDERWWIGETILQQFIGAVAYRQAKEGKQHCRGMFITTSAFTNGAKEMLNKMSDKFVGYDGDDLYETAKECQFGLIKDEKGNWKIDEELLSGNKSFFFML